MSESDSSSPVRAEPARLTVAAPLELRRDAAGPQLRLARQPLLWFVELAEDIDEHAAFRAARHLHCDPDATGDAWSSGDPEFPWLADPQQGLYLAGERHLAWFEAGSGRMIPTPGVQWHFGKGAETIDAGGSGRITVWLVNGGEHAESAREIVAHDWSGTGVASGDRVIVAQHLQSRRWYILARAAGSPGTAPCCQMIEVRQGVSALPVSLADGTSMPVAFDEIAIVSSDIFSLAGGSGAGEVSVLATGRAEIYHHDAAQTGSIPSGENLSEWWIERKPPSAATFAVLPQSMSRMHHANLDHGQETKFLRRLVDVAYGDTFRVQARRVAGSDTLVGNTLADSTTTNYFGIRFVCCGDPVDHTAALVSLADAPYDQATGIGGAAYDPTTGAGRRTLKLAAYYRLEEAGTSEDRADQSGQARTLRVLAAGSASIPGVVGHVNNAADIDAASEWLGRGGFGDPNPEIAFRPLSQVVSVAGWVQFADFSGVSGTANVIGLGNDNAWRVVVDSAGNISAITGQSGGMGHPNAVATVSGIPAGKPLLLTASFEGLLGRAAIRLRSADDSFDQTATNQVAAPTGWAAAPATWHLDVGSSAAGSWVALQVEQLGIWFDAVLAPSQGNFLFAAGAGRRLM